MPHQWNVIHIELKKSNVAIPQAVDQIRKYTHEGFTCYLLSVQILVVMNWQTVYFANPGYPDAFLNPSYQFHWETLTIIQQWLPRGHFQLLSIPMAHQLVFLYHRWWRDGGSKSHAQLSVQCRSTNYLCVRSHDWKRKPAAIWHTTGSGKQWPASNLLS